MRADRARTPPDTTGSYEGGQGADTAGHDRVVPVQMAGAESEGPAGMIPRST